MTDNAHATPSCTASRTLPPSWTSGWHNQPPFPSPCCAHTLPVAIVKYHLSFSQRPSIAVYHPTSLAATVLPSPLSARTYYTGSSFVIFLYLVALFSLKAKAALGAEKRMENQFLTSGCYFSCQRFKAVAGAIKQREREKCRGR